MKSKNKSKIWKHLKNHFFYSKFCLKTIVLLRETNAILLVFQYKDFANQPELPSPADSRIQGG